MEEDTVGPGSIEQLLTNNGADVSKDFDAALCFTFFILLICFYLIRLEYYLYSSLLSISECLKK